jgi:hypothetical protein
MLAYRPNPFEGPDTL